jgi:NodT family efflux transporter outer membrane factor (OMF) lipoprotein
MYSATVFKLPLRPIERFSPSMPRAKVRFRLFRRLVSSRYVLVGTAAVFLCGCSSLKEFIHNGCKVGPNYAPPPAPVESHWIDADDARVRSESADYSQWWTVFKDPTLNDLIQTSYRQNLTVREAGFRVLAARAQLGITEGELFPQTQVMNGSATSRGLSKNVANRVATPQRWFGQFEYGFGVAWELDFWGRFRRSIEAAEATLDASVDNYDDVLVTLLGDVATAYVDIRTYQQQIANLTQLNDLQRQSFEVADAKFKGGQTSKVDVDQAQSEVSHTKATIEETRIRLRQATNRLCVLLGQPPEALDAKLGNAAIPVPPPEVIVGVPADLLRRRPDVRRAEREAAAQSARIGVAQADFYPQISLNANFGWSAKNLEDLFASGSFREVVGPSFQWPILNYGRIRNNVRLQDAQFQGLVLAYQQTALTAAREVEDGLVEFLRSQLRTRDESEAVKALTEAYKEALSQYKNGLTDYNRVIVIQERLVQRQVLVADAERATAVGLIQVYRALGGGWEIRCRQSPAAGPQAPAVGPVAPAPGPKGELPPPNSQFAIDPRENAPDSPGWVAQKPTELRPANRK